MREGHASDVEGLVVDVALRCARRHLDEGDVAGVEAARAPGLRVAPCEERLYALRMQAAQRAGDTARVRRLLAELCAVVEDDVAPLRRRPPRYRGALQAPADPDHLSVVPEVHCRLRGLSSSGSVVRTGWR